jgi:predicted TIM-barrel fold metal-dependent hydrolase
MFRFVIGALCPCLLLLTAACGQSPADSQPHAGQAGDQAAPRFEDIVKIDVHSHNFEDMPQLHDMLRRTNTQAVNVAVPGTSPHLETMHRIAADLAKNYPGLHHFTATFDLTRRHEPGWADEVIAALDEAFAQGAVAVKIWKEVGIDLRRPDGTFLLPDDDIFDPIYAHLARRGKPLQAHLAEPREAWLPLDPDSVHHGYYSRNPQWHLYGKPEYPSHEDIIAARDRIMEKHPTLVVLGAHLGSLEHDVDEVARRLDRYPNFYVEVAARTQDLVAQPSDKVRQFFLAYPERILYGVDRTWMPFAGDTPPTDEERAAFVEALEAHYRLDYAYYAGSGTVEYRGRPAEALALPRGVLERFYHANAQRLLTLTSPGT